MGESFTHSTLAKELIDWVKDNFKSAIIFADTSIYQCNTKPPNINGHVPDVYAKDIINEKIIIGEAKTRNDLERQHSINQFKAYLQYCSVNVNCTLVIIIPWDMSFFINNLVNRLKRELDLRTTINIKIIKSFVG